MSATILGLATFHHAHASALDAEIAAGLRALEDARVEAADVDLLLSCSRDWPGIARRIGLERAAAFELAAGDASPIAQTVLACAMVESGRARHALLTQSLAPSRVGDGQRDGGEVGCASAMVVGTAVEEGFGLVAHVARADAMDAPTDGAASTSERRVAVAADTLAVLFDLARMRRDDLDVLASTQPTADFPTALAELVGVPRECAPIARGPLHAGSVSVVANLLAARARGLLTEGAIVAMYGHADGETTASALLRWGIGAAPR